MKLKPAILIVAALFVLVIIVPSLLVLPYSSDKTFATPSDNLKNRSEQPVAEKPEDTLSIAVYRSNQGAIENLDLEDYVIGVVASEMPADFELEALKAQALTARTYIIRQLLYPSEIKLPDGADVTDTIYHQVYRNDQEYQELWGKDYDWKLQKVKEAVYGTAGEILTYNDEPITAAFFSTSNGYTVNSEDYWSNPFPYLKSVPSPWDVSSPRYEKDITISVKKFEQSLGVSLANKQTIGEVISKTSGNRIGKIKIDGKTFTGREVRQKLKLDSTDFTWKRSGNQIQITTKGYGHGVGMSQYGANGMALEGKSYQDIVKYYYKGVKISTTKDLLPSLKKKK